MPSTAVAGARLPPVPLLLAAAVLAGALAGCTGGPSATVATLSSGAACTPATSLGDRDDDLSPFGEACATLTTVTEHGETWRVQTISSGRPGPLFVVPHDNENAAMATAAYALSRYGGSVTAVETGGKRFNGKVDPNRNFAGGRLSCAAGPSPAFVQAMLAPGGSPIVALHTNDRGSGTISIRTPYAGATPFPSANARGGLASEDAMVILASRSGPADPAIRRKLEALNAAGVNVLVETVDLSRTDCSLSHWAVANGRAYANVEVPHGDAATQKAILDILMPLL